jgi:hypothetical protein
MRILLACLMCIVLAASECFAIKGGPDYGSAGVRTTGTYAAVMTPSADSPAANSIGLFSVQIPKTGLGTGPLVIFEQGQTYVGTVQGTADPDSGKLTLLVYGSFPYITTVPSGTDSMGNPTFTTVTVIAVASGQLKGRIKANPNAFSTASARIVGKSDVEFSLTVNNPFDEIIYDVRGFKQSET